MKIVIYYQSLVNYARKNPDKDPLPGTESAVLRMAQALRNLGHLVHIVTNPAQLKRHQNIDILISKRNPIIPLLYPTITRHHYFWSPDLTNEPSFLPLQSATMKKKFIVRIQKVIAISNFQGALYKKIGIPKEKIYVSRNGFDEKLLEQSAQQNQYRCIYFSTYCDGLAYLAPVWKKVIAKVPQSTLCVIAARSVYKTKIPADIKNELKKLERFSSVTIKPPMSQKALFRELLQSSVFFYPNTLDETSSMATIEARVAGCLIVTSKRGALKESAAGNVLLRGHPSSQQYQKEAAEIIINSLINPKQYSDIKKANENSRHHYSWQTIAKEWEALFLNALTK